MTRGSAKLLVRFITTAADYFSRLLLASASSDQRPVFTVARLRFPYRNFCCAFSKFTVRVGSAVNFRKICNCEFQSMLRSMSRSLVDLTLGLRTVSLGALLSQIDFRFELLTSLLATHHYYVSVSG